jgi:hypothetical protein
LLIGNPSQQKLLIGNPSQQKLLIGNPSQQKLLIGNPSHQNLLIGNPSQQNLLIGNPSQQISLTLQPLPTAMTITVKSLGTDTMYNLQYYYNIRVGQYVVLVAGPALGSKVEEDGDVYESFVLNGAHVFTKDNKNKYLSEVMQDGATLHHSLCLGRIEQCLIGNGGRMPPIQYQLMLHSSNEVVVDSSASDYQVSQDLSTPHSAVAHTSSAGRRMRRRAAIERLLLSPYDIINPMQMVWGGI